MPNMGLGFPSDGCEEDLVVIPLTLPVVWKNTISILFTYTEIVAKLDNTTLLCNHPYRKHKQYSCTEALLILDSPPLKASLTGLSHNIYLSCTNTKPTAYVDIFSDKCFGLYEGTAHRRRYARRTLSHTLDKVIQPL